MSKVYIIILLVFIVSGNSISQDYFNLLLSPDNTNFLTKEIYSINEEFVIPYDYNSDVNGQRSAIYITNLSDSYEVEIGEFNLGPQPLVKLDDFVFFVGKDITANPNEVSILKVDKDYNTLWLENFEAINDIVTTVGFLSHEENLYTLNTVRSFNGPWKDIEILKISSAGELIWSKVFTQNAEYSAGWDLISTFDNNIIFSQILRSNNSLNSKDRIVKIDEQGNIIWEFESNDFPENGSTPIRIIELNDRSLIEMYVVDRWNDPQFTINDWDKSPTLIRGLHETGEINFEKLIIFTRRHNLNYHDIKAGSGDYFFAFGSYEETDLDINSGIITKFSNSADTIWTRKVRHPDFVQNSEFVIRDIIEFADGDILCFGMIIDKVTEAQFMWIFKINKDGCFGLEECDDSILSSTANEFIEGYKIFPNPTQSIIEIQGIDIETVEAIEIFNLSGAKVLSINNLESSILEISQLQEGMYKLILSTKTGRFVKSIIKI